MPSKCSWLNLIELWFAELTNRRIRRGSFLSVDDLVAAMEDFLAAWNQNPRPFVWTPTVDSIVAKLTCYYSPIRMGLPCFSNRSLVPLSCGLSMIGKL